MTQDDRVPDLLSDPTPTPPRRRRPIRGRPAAAYQSAPNGVGWRAPGGGFFVWVRLPAGLDSADLLPRAEAAGVSYVPGARFYADGRRSEHVRLAFTLLTEEELEDGARRLASVLRG